MKTDTRTIEERLKFAHACTGEPLFAQALQRIEQLKSEVDFAFAMGRKTGEREMQDALRGVISKVPE